MRQIPFAPNYTADENGNIYKPNGKLAGTSPNKKEKGYMRVCLNCKQYYVHRVILETFVGPCPEGCETRHLNGNNRDNRLQNLCWGTKKENEADKLNHGTHQSITKPNRRLTDEQVEYILSSPKTNTALAKELNVTQATISRVRTGSCYAERDRNNMPEKRTEGSMFKRGEDNHFAKITPEIVLAIRASTDNLALTAERFGISIQQVSRIRLRQRWSHIPG
jgi:hypothetical protein